MNAPLPPYRLLLSVAALALAGCGSDASEASASAADIFVVKRGPLRISLKENAELAASEETRVRSQMEGQNTVIFLVKEGSRVEKGDKLVELDASQVIEKRANQEISVARARAALVSAQKALDIQEKQNQAELLGATNDLRIAEMNQEKFVGRDLDGGTRQMGEAEQLRRDAEDNIKLAQQELKLAEDRLTWSERLKAKDFITKNELERDQLDADRKRYQVQRATNQKSLLQDYDLAIRQIEVEQKVIEAKLALERVVAQGDAKLAQATAEVESREAELKLAQERLDNLEQQVKNAVITAPTPGLVVYAFEGDGMRRREVVEEGSSVRERQSLIVLPNITRMVANLSVHEAMVDRVAVGQPALVRVDAFPDRIFPARVRTVSSLADSSQRSFNPTAKLYKTSVELLGEDHDLKPNMAASCEIIISEHKDVLFVPVQAVQRQGAVSFVWVESRQGPTAKPLELGVHDYSYVIIENGLTEGDRIYLVAPAGAKAPEFPQPKDPLPNRAVLSEAASQSGPPTADDGNGRRRGGDGNGGRRGGRSNPAMTEFRTAFKAKYPDLAAKAEEDPRAMFTDEDIQRAIQEDADLKAKWDAMRAGFGRRRGGGGGPGGGGNGNGSPGGQPSDK
ncbi:MAG: efflux RND transporter periplasmic adaptor subunit [Planctomycetota bacterium]